LFGCGSAALARTTRQGGQIRAVDAFAVDMRSRPALVDAQMTRMMLPATQDDQARSTLRLVDRAVHVADDDDVGPVAAGGGVGSIDSQMALFVLVEPALVLPGEELIEPAGDRLGEQAEQAEERP